MFKRARHLTHSWASWIHSTPPYHTLFNIYFCMSFFWFVSSNKFWNLLFIVHSVNMFLHKYFVFPITSLVLSTSTSLSFFTFVSFTFNYQAVYYRLLITWVAEKCKHLGWRYHRAAGFHCSRWAPGVTVPHKTTLSTPRRGSHSQEVRV